MAQVVVDSLLTTYVSMGRGPVLLLLHGWGDSSGGLKDLIKDLSNSFSVVCLDLPGFAGTQAPENTWGLSEYAEFVSRFCQKIKISPAVIVGHSNGGAIAIRGLSEGRLSPDRLVLVASAGVRGEYKGRIKATRLITKLGKALSAPLPKSAKNKLRNKVYSTVGSDMLVAEHLQETFKRIVEDDVRVNAKNVKVPTLLIYGEKDTSTPVEFGVVLNGLIKGSELHVIEGADHWTPTKNTAEVAKLIREFSK